MILLDVNVLVYAYSEDASEHQATKRYMEELFAGPEVLGIPWITIWGFLRVITNPRAAHNPASLDEAFALVRDWLSVPTVTPIGPGPRHLELLEQLATRYGISGARMTDVSLAALAIENGAVLASTDRGFGRFRELNWVNPLD
ncbi:MAG TPA: TA system VapC family ribonuclease toxin, partial [Bryobacteraceae bacterium]